MYYIAHSGTKGMRWYHRFHQSYKTKPTRSGKIGQEHFRKSNVVSDILKENKTKNVNKNIDKWGKDKDHNILFITGESGSGKSTLANKFKSDDVDVIHLDLYYDANNKKYESKSFNKYMDSHYLDYKKLKFPKDKKALNEWGKLCERFEQEVDNYGKEQFKKGRKVIVEGVQLLDDTYRPDKKYFEDKPVVLCTTNSLKSRYRAMKRDNIEFTPNELFREAKNSFRWNRDIRIFKKEVGLSKR